VLQAENDKRKRAEEALRESEEQWRDVFENNPTMYFIVDVAGTVLSVNPFGAEQLGYTVNELVGHSVLNVFYEADRDAVQRNVSICLEQLGQSMSWEFRKVRKDGRVIWVRETAKAVLRAKIHPIVLIVCEDITDRKQVEDKLRHSEAYLAEAQRLSHTGSLGWRVSSGEIFWSEETFRIFECDPATKPTVELVLQRVHPEDVALVRQIWDRASDRKNLDLEHRLLMSDGSVKYVHVVAHALRDESGNLEFVGSVMDVTATKRAFREIQGLKDQLYKENLALKEEIDRSSMFEEIVGASPVLQDVLARIAKVAPTDSTVLITGETGTGKELIARAIHKRSPRAARAFVNVNCAATPPSLIASELFGHEKGAFTGALQRRLGRFELAEGGTIFLDEIGELPAETQIALLRVLQEREFERVGGTHTIRAEVRVIAATNRDLHAAIAAGTFRRDLYYRLNVFPIESPPLRERQNDILLLVEYFIDRYASKAGKKIRGVTKKTLELLQSYPWPGNIRELQNVIERSVILCETETFSIDESWLSRESLEAQPAGQPFSDQLVTQEKTMIEAALAAAGGRVSGPSGAAAKLGLPPSTLDSKIRSLKISKHRFKPL
jgi:PAS domain S-box-containing protein